MLTSKSPRTCKKDTKEIWDVKEVPLKFEGFSKPSSAIERLLLKRRRDHENVLKNMRDSIFIISEEYNEHFQELCTCLKMKVESVRQTIQDHQNQFLEMNLSEIRDKESTMIWNFINILVEKEKAIIKTSFEENVQRLERDRRGRSKSVFVNCFKALMDISYMLPRDMEILLEKEISNYNRIILENHKAYECLYLEICLLFNTFNLNLEKWIEDVKIIIKEACRLEDLRMLKSKKEVSKCAGSLFLKSEAGKIVFSILRSRENVITDLLSQWKVIIPFSTATLEEQFSELEEIILLLEKEKEQFLETYYSILKDILNEFCSEVENFSELYKESVTKEEDELINKMVEDIKNEYEEVLSRLENEWKDIMIKLKENSLEAFGVLHKFALLWEQELSQIAEVQNKILLLLESTKAKNKKVNQSLETKLNSKIKNIRQGINKVTLTKQLNQINTNLNRIEEKFKSDFQKELKIIEKYDESITRELSELEKKIDKFLQINSSEKNLVPVIDYYFQEVEGEENIILHQVRLFGKEVTSILQWTSKILENITLQRFDLVKNLKTLSDSWKDGLISKCSHKLENLLQIYDQRSTTISEVYEIRVKEIKSHNDCLEEHKQFVNAELKEITTKPDGFWSEVENDFKNYEQEIFELSEHTLQAEETLKMKYLRIVINKKRRNFENLIKSEAESFITEIKNTFLALDNRNEDLFAEIKLFKDDGNFNLEEAKIMRRRLTTLKTSIKKSQSETLSKFETALAQMLSEIDKNEKDVIDKSKDTMQNLEFMEFITSTVDKCHNYLETKLQNLVNADEKLINDLNNVVEVFENKLMAQFPVKTMFNDWMKLLEAIENQFQYLKIRLPNLSRSKLIEGHKNKVTKHESSKTDDNENVLLDSTLPSENENNFSALIMTILSNTLSKIRAKSSDYLLKMGKHSTSELAHAEFNYHHFTQKAEQQLCSYYVIAKKVWMQEIGDFFSLIKIYKKMLQNWILSNFTEYNEFIEQSIIAKKTDALKIVNEMIKHETQKRNKNRQSVKVTHGFPKNRQNLENLNEKVQREEKEMCEKVEKMFQTFVEQFKEFSNVYKIGLAEIAEDLAEIFDKLKIIDEILEFEFTLINEESQNSDRSLNSERNSKMNLRRDSAFKYAEFQKLKIPKKSIFIEDWKIYKEQNERFKAPEIFNSIDLTSKMKVLIEEYIEQMQSVCLIAMRAVEEKTKKFLLEGKEFLSWWRQNIETVPEVYNLN